MNSAPTFPDYVPSNHNAPSALSGLRVVDFTRVLAGPWATQYLADLGADVIKIEEPGGDMSRYGNGHVQEDISGFYLCTNRNKRSIVLNLRSEEGRRIAIDLIARADVVVENYTSRVMKDFGLDYARLKEDFPRLIYCSISAYGRTGTLSDAPGFDPIIACETGIASLNAIDGATPFASSLPIIDLSAGMNAAIAILGALVAREKLGSGQFVETSLYDSAIANLSYKGSEYLATGKRPFVLGRRWSHPPGGEFLTKNGTIWFATASDKIVSALFHKVLNRPDLDNDLRFSSFQNRKDNIEELLKEVSAVLLQDDAETWASRLKAAGVPGGAVRSVEDAYHAPLTQERGLISTIPHAKLGRVANVSSPIRLSLTPTVDPVAAPNLNEHANSILLDELQYTKEEVEHLHSVGAFDIK